MRRTKNSARTAAIRLLEPKHAPLFVEVCWVGVYPNEPVPELCPPGADVGPGSKSGELCCHCKGQEKEGGRKV